MAAKRTEGPWTRLVFGLILVSVGLIVWLDQLGRLEASQYLRWWPLALVAMGLANLIQRRYDGALIWTLIGLFFLIPRLGLSRIWLWRLIGLWPLLISAAGVTVILHVLRRLHKQQRGATFRSFAWMAGDVRVVRTVPLAGGEMVAVMGGCEAVLAGAPRGHEPIVIDVLAFWGGIEIAVPAGWRVTNRITEILAGCEDKTAGGSEDAPHVIVQGAAIMAGVEIRNWQEELS